MAPGTWRIEITLRGLKVKPSQLHDATVALAKDSGTIVDLIVTRLGRCDCGCDAP